MKQTIELYSVIPPNKNDIEDFPLVDCLSDSADSAWDKFCYPALNRVSYENDGFKAKKVKVTVEVI